MEILTHPAPELRAKNSAIREKEFGASGLLARVICHEVDHLDGILILDRHEHFKGGIHARPNRLQKTSREHPA